MNLFERASRVLPGGVNSPVRAFGSVHMDPPFFVRADGPFVYDTEGKTYADFITSWGPMILGHGPKDLIERAKDYFDEGISFGLPTLIEVEMAELFCSAVETDMVRMVNSGTEATMSAIRLARGYTNKRKVVKFEGCYHGHSDALLVKSGSGTLTYNAPTSLGVPKETLEHTLVCRYNDLDNVRETIAPYADDIACIILEPIAGNMGVVPATKEFLQGLRTLCDEIKALLIFDEVISGFRLRYGSVAKDFDVTPDLLCFGKIIGGGLPVGAFTGRREIMELLSPLGGVYQAGTLSGNPLAMKMGRDMLLTLRKDQDLYTRLEEKAKVLEGGFLQNLKDTGIPGTVTRYKSMMSLFFGEFESITSYDDVKAADTELYAQYFQEMMKRGFLFAPAQFEAIFLCDAHDDAMIEDVLRANRESLEAIAKKRK